MSEAQSSAWVMLQAADIRLQPPSTSSPQWPLSEPLHLSGVGGGARRKAEMKEFEPGCTLDGVLDRLSGPLHFS